MRDNKLDNLRINLGKWDEKKEQRYNISTYRKKRIVYRRIQDTTPQKHPIYIEVIYPNGFNNEVICYSKTEARKTLMAFLEQDLIKTFS